MAYQECPRCGSLRLILNFNTPEEQLEPCGYCHDGEQQEPEEEESD
jgi:uncharacterized protein (DUF983 family)